MVDSVQDTKRASWFNGERAVVLAIQRQPHIPIRQLALLDPCSAWRADGSTSVSAIRDGLEITRGGVAGPPGVSGVPGTNEFISSTDEIRAFVEGFGSMLLGMGLNRCDRGPVGARPGVAQ